MLILLLANCSPAPPPNLVLIIGDDHGYPYSGFSGSSFVQTPNLDELALAGTHFPVVYNTDSLCRPSLLSLLTGLHPYEWERGKQQLREGRKPVKRGWDVTRFATLPQILGSHGYATFQAGKLYEGDYAMSGFSEGTKRQLGGTQIGARYAGGRDGLRIGRETMKPIYDFIDRHHDEPFFLWFAPMLPHSPFDAPMEYLELYQNSAMSLSARAYYANVSWFDAVVGDLVAHLDKYGLRDRTLVVYLSDNGFEQHPDQRLGFNPGGGLRGKGSMHEIGLRTPIIFNWTGHVPAGQVRPALVSTVDLFQTLLDYAGLEPPPEREGHSLRPLVEGRSETVREEIIGIVDRLAITKQMVLSGEADPEPNHRLPDPGVDRTLFLRDSRWHYFWEPSTRRQRLYDIVADPFENEDLAPGRPDITEQLRSRIWRWKAARDRPIVLRPRVERSGATRASAPRSDQGRPPDARATGQRRPRRRR